MKTVTKNVYVADDGKEFTTEAECLSHERAKRTLAQRLRLLKVYSISHGFDATEGKGYFAKTFIISDAKFQVVLQYCFDKFGPILRPWYGDSFFEEWIISESSLSAAQALQEQGKVPHYAHRPTEVIVVSSNDFTESDLPTSEFPWPRKKD